MAPIKSRGGRGAPPVRIRRSTVSDMIAQRIDTQPRSADDMWVHDMHDKPHATRSVVPSGPPTAQLLVSNLHYEVTAKDLAVCGSFEELEALTLM